MRDHRDAALEQLAADEGALIDRVVDLEARLDGYRLIVFAALERSAELERQLESQRAITAALREELRRLTAAAALAQRRVA